MGVRSTSVSKPEKKKPDFLYKAQERTPIRASVKETVKETGKREKLGKKRKNNTSS